MDQSRHFISPSCNICVSIPFSWICVTFSDSDFVLLSEVWLIKKYATNKECVRENIKSRFPLPDLPSILSFLPSFLSILAWSFFSLSFLPSLTSLDEKTSYSWLSHLVMPSLSFLLIFSSRSFSSCLHHHHCLPCSVQLDDEIQDTHWFSLSLIFKPVLYCCKSDVSNSFPSCYSSLRFHSFFILFVSPVSLSWTSLLKK